MVLARIGNYGPHIVAALGMSIMVVWLGLRLKLPNWQFALFALFVWQLHETLSQVPLNLAHGTFQTWLFSNAWPLAAISIGAGVYFFHSRMKLRVLPWLVFLGFVVLYASLGWPITFPPSPQILWVGLFENAYHIYFTIGFWSLFL